MDSIMPIIANIAQSPFFFFCLGLLAAWALLLVGLWSWRRERERIQALVKRIRAIHAQAGSHPRHLPSLASGYRFFSESINWEFRLDRELNALEHQRGVRIPYSQRRLSASTEEVLNSFTQRVEALEGLST